MLGVCEAKYLHWEVVAQHWRFSQDTVNSWANSRRQHFRSFKAEVPRFSLPGRISLQRTLLVSDVGSCFYESVGAKSGVVDREEAGFWCMIYSIHCFTDAIQLSISIPASIHESATCACRLNMMTFRKAAATHD